jgi:hypothetical protein
MSDIVLPAPAELSAQSLGRAACIAMLLAFALVLAAVQIDECWMSPGDFSKDFSARDFNVSHKVCGQSALAMVMAHKALDALPAVIVACR